MALYLRTADTGDALLERQDLSLRLAMMSLVNVGLQSVALAFHAWQGALSWPLLVAFMGVASGVPVLFALLMGSSLGSRIGATALLPMQAAVACGVQLAFVLAAPELSVLFLFGIMITFNTFMLGTKPRDLSAVWLAVAVASGIALWLVRDRFRYPDLNDVGLFALWLYFFLAVRQLTSVGVRCGILRSVLNERRLRLSRTVARLHERAGDERVLERERISRELHDTLLQGVQALVLRIHAANDGIAHDQPARGLIERNLARADEVIVEARERLGSLREGQGAARDATELFDSSVRSVAHDFGIPADFQVNGRPRRLPLDDEVARLGRELIVNAFRYAGVGAIQVILDHGTASLGLRLHERHGDFAPTQAERRAHDDGVEALSRRACDLGAEIVVAHLRGGVEVLLKVPNAVAYRNRGANGRTGGVKRPLDAAA